MPHIFISYSKTDIDFARHLRHLLEAAGFAVWMDESRLHPSARWWPEIENNIEACAAFIIVMSPHSRESEWVERELLYAERREKPIFPVLLAGEDWPRLANIQFADMRAGVRATLPEPLLNELKSRVLVKPLERVPDRLPSGARAAAAPARVKIRPTTSLWLSGTVVAVLVLLALGAIWLGLSGGDQTPTAVPTRVSDIGSVSPTPDATGLPSATPPMPTSTATSRPSATPNPTVIPSATPTLIPALSPNGSWTPVVAQVKGIPVVYVPAGCLLMGIDDEFWGPEDGPVHEVCVHAFWIGLTEVTNAQYRMCVDTGACDLPKSRQYYDDPVYADHPVVNVTWNQASAFAYWAGGSLPTEAQWEYAARGPESWLFPWGNGQPTCDQANMGGCVADTLPAGPDQRAAGASWVGALDMSGNVWEWVKDWYGPYSAEQQMDPAGPPSGQYHIIRGGSWQPYQSNPIAAHRRWSLPDEDFDIRGLRVVFLDPLSGR
jgi:formylglycine-generating enzyme required for sulfatase activity